MILQLRRAKELVGGPGQVALSLGAALKATDSSSVKSCVTVEAEIIRSTDLHFFCVRALIYAEHVTSLERMGRVAEFSDLH